MVSRVFGAPKGSPVAYSVAERSPFPVEGHDMLTQAGVMEPACLAGQREGWTLNVSQPILDTIRWKQELLRSDAWIVWNGRFSFHGVQWEMRIQPAVLCLSFYPFCKTAWNLDACHLLWKCKWLLFRFSICPSMVRKHYLVVGICA